MEKYGVTLTRMRAQDMELVRAWRNDPEIMRYMFGQQPITEQEQRKWFDGITDRGDYYFIVESGGLPVGQVSLSRLDGEEGAAESGVLIYGENQGKGLGKKAMTALLAVAFYELGLRLVRAVMREDNVRSQKLHMALGYRSEGDDDGKAVFILPADDYRAAKEKMYGGGAVLSKVTSDNIYYVKSAEKKARPERENK